MYDADYSERVAAIRDWLEGIGNLQQVGRNGLHRYNNSDHSMLTAMRAVENVIAGTKHDLWAVNAESAYHEEHQEPEQPYRRVPSTQYEREPLHARVGGRCLRTYVRLAASGAMAFCVPRFGGRSDGLHHLTEGAADGFAGDGRVARRGRFSLTADG